MPHIVEIWELVGEGRLPLHAAWCLSCGWVGRQATRPQAEREGELHEVATDSRLPLGLPDAVAAERPEDRRSAGSA